MLLTVGTRSSIGLTFPQAIEFEAVGLCSLFTRPRTTKKFDCISDGVFGDSRPGLITYR